MLTRTGLLLLTATLMLMACTGTAETAGALTPEPTPAGDEHADNGAPGASGASDPRTFVVDWDRAAETSAGGFERDVVPLRITVPLPDGWYSDQGWALLKHRAIPPAGAGITFERPLALFADRCRWDDPDGLIEVGPTVDDLVETLVGHPQYRATNVTAVTIDGFEGKALDMVGVLEDFDLADCSPGVRPDGSEAPHLHRPWAGRYWMGPTEENHVRVLDVAGERVVIRAMYFSHTSQEDLAELFDLLENIRIEIER